MARKRFTPEQIVAVLREAERGADHKELYRKHGICEQTFYRWRRMYGGLSIAFRLHEGKPGHRLILARERHLLHRAPTLADGFAEVYAGRQGAAVLVSAIPAL
jgi:hypothetical protein